MSPIIFAVPVFAVLALTLVVASPTRAGEPEPSAPAESPRGDEPASDEAEKAPPKVPELTAEELEAIERAVGGAEDAAPEPAPAPAGQAGTFSLNPDLSLILDVAGAWFSKDETGQLGAHDPSRTGFNFQQLELHAFANVDPHFRFDANLVFSQFGVEVEEAYATTLGLPGRLMVRAGQFLNRFGKRNATHPHAWQFLDQALVLGKFFGGEGGRGLGVEVSWLAPTPWYLELVAGMSDAAGGCCARSMLGGDDLGVHGLEDFLYTVALKQFWDLDEALGLSLGLSLQTGPNASGLGNRSLLAGGDLFLRYKPPGGGFASVDLLVEVIWRGRELPGRFVEDVGGFAELAWRVDREWALAGRYEWVGGVANDPLDPEWTGARQRGAVACDLYPSHFSRLRLQVGADAREWEEGLGWMAMLGLEVVVGAHGAHAY